jgi:transcriptional regulator of arginine metabolism
MHKTKRQQKIINLIGARRIGTQQELTALLERAGFVATQSSISRDLEELGVVKHNGHYTLPRASEGAAARGLLGLDAAGDCLVVAKCEAGLASAVAVQIDRAGIPEIVGTLAGEDTVFIAVHERKAQRAVMKKVLEIFG